MKLSIISLTQAPNVTSTVTQELFFVSLSLSEKLSKNPFEEFYPIVKCKLKIIWTFFFMRNEEISWGESALSLPTAIIEEFQSEEKKAEEEGSNVLYFESV
jgi:hypothetical protein